MLVEICILKVLLVRAEKEVRNIEEDIYIISENTYIIITEWCINMNVKGTAGEVSDINKNVLETGGKVALFT